MRVQIVESEEIMGNNDVVAAGDVLDYDNGRIVADSLVRYGIVPHFLQCLHRTSYDACPAGNVQYASLIFRHFRGPFKIAILIL